MLGFRGEMVGDDGAWGKAASCSNGRGQFERAMPADAQWWGMWSFLTRTLPHNTLLCRTRSRMHWSGFLQLLGVQEDATGQAARLRSPLQPLAVRKHRPPRHIVHLGLEGLPDFHASSPWRGEAFVHSIKRAFHMRRVFPGFGAECKERGTGARVAAGTRHFRAPTHRRRRRCQGHSADDSKPGASGSPPGLEES